MNNRPVLEPRTDAEDQALRWQLRALKTPDAQIDALGDRVLAQWRELNGESASATQPGRPGAAMILGGHMTTRRWRWVGITTGLLIGAVIVTVMWVQKPDPTLDELMQADVLSQMAIGEL